MLFLHVYFLHFESVIVACVLWIVEVPVCKNFTKGVRTFWHFHLCLYHLRLLCKTGSLKWSRLKVSVFKWTFWWFIAQLVNSCISSLEKVLNCTFRMGIESCFKNWLLCWRSCIVELQSLKGPKSQEGAVFTSCLNVWRLSLTTSSVWVLCITETDNMAF